MAEGKKSFVLYADYKHTFELLTDEQAGKLIKHIISYVNDENPTCSDKIIEIAFAPIKQQLKRDLSKWEEKKVDFSDAGKESAKSRRLSKPQLYVLRFFGNDEQFVKIGITDYSVGRRYSSSGEGGSKLGYKFDILYQHFPKEGENLAELELIIKEMFKNQAYEPKQKFGGHTECYKMSVANKVADYLTSLNVVEQLSTKPTVTVNDTATVNVTVNDNNTNTIPSETWDGIKLKWKSDWRWIDKFCMDNGNLDRLFILKKMDDFLADLDTQEDFKQIPGLKRHFFYWYKKHHDGSAKNIGNSANGSAKLGTSDARTEALRKW